MLNTRSLLRRLRSDRRAVAAVIVAAALPAVIITTGVAADAAFVEIRVSQLQTAADAAATAARQSLDSYTAGYQSAATTQAQLLANGNIPSSLAAGDVVQGWWDITTNPKTFGPPVPGQTGALFSNAVQVTTRLVHRPVFGQLLGVPQLNLSRKAIGYKCSNTDYPLTVIPDDANPPDKPAIYMTWASDGRPANTSYYYANTGGRQNPVIKFWSPTDGEDVSFVVSFSDGSKLQVDTYCRGTFLIVPDAFDWKGKKNITATVQRGSTNNSFDVYPDQSKYPTLIPTNTYSPTGSTNQTISYLRPDKVHVTPYPSSNGIQYWASEGNPTPDRRTILVK